jgi:acetyl esterase/lipase
MRFCLLFVLLASTAAAGLPQPDEKIVYKKTPQCELKVHIFKPEGHQPTDKRPCIVFFYGGAWRNGAPSQFYAHSRYLTTRGMVCIGPEYRTRDRHGTTPAECVKDGKSAMRWVKANAAKLGIDPDRIIAGGGSAGGHVAAATATLEKFNEEGDDLSIECRPKALVLYNPVYDNSEKGYGYDLVKDYWRDFSPVHNMDQNTPPTLVMLGSKDDLLSVPRAKEVQKMMRDLGVRSELETYDKQPHGFFNYRDGKNPYYYRTVIAMDKFLSSLGYIEGPPTLVEPEGLPEREHKKRNPCD